MAEIRKQLPGLVNSDVSQMFGIRYEAYKNALSSLSMSRLGITATVFICILGATAAGVALSHFLSNGHPSNETEEIISAAGSLVTSLTAFTIGYLIAGGKTTFDFSANELKALAAKAILLDGILVQYGPAAHVARVFLRQALTKTINLISVPPTTGKEALGDLRMEVLLDTILCLTPQNEKQCWLRTSALSLCSSITSSLSMAYVNLGTEIEPLLLIALVFWLSSIFLGFGFLVPLDPIALGGLFVAALAMTSAINLTLRFYAMPFEVFARIRIKPLGMALDQIANNLTEGLDESVRT